MKPQALRKSYSAQCKEVKSLLISFGNDGDILTLQKFRFSINKLFAMYRILEYSNKKGLKKFPKKILTNLYFLSGEIKDAYNNHQLISLLSMQDIDIIEKNSKNLESLFLSFRKKINSYLKKLAKIESIHKKHFSKVSKNDIIKYTLLLNKRIRKNLNIKCDDKSLRLASKVLTEALFNSEILNEKDLELLEIDLKSVHNLKQLIDQWDEKSNFLATLEDDFNSKYLGIVNINYRKQLKKSTALLKSALRQEIDNRIVLLFPEKKDN
jgi:hypothetical protein